MDNKNIKAKLKNRKFKKNIILGGLYLSMIAGVYIYDKTSIHPESPSLSTEYETFYFDATNKIETIQNYDETQKYNSNDIKIISLNFTRNSLYFFVKCVDSYDNTDTANVTNIEDNDVEMMKNYGVKIKKDGKCISAIKDYYYESIFDSKILLNSDQRIKVFSDKKIFKTEYYSFKYKYNEYSSKDIIIKSEDKTLYSDKMRIITTPYKAFFQQAFSIKIKDFNDFYSYDDVEFSTSDLKKMQDELNYGIDSNKNLSIN